MKGTHQGHHSQIDALYRAILSLKTTQDCRRFFRDLLTIEEITEFSKRWQAVRLLNQNKSYREVARQTGLSTTTVARVAHWLYRGEGGYNLALKRIDK
ncbi:MAG: helix-turn-helix domain-containing protein [Candidatus Buchananbacteria bacterium]|nr:helix-turn-helix domain-containing protein [Candidatus Buchananbacteria bacterium]